MSVTRTPLHPRKSGVNSLPVDYSVRPWGFETTLAGVQGVEPWLAVLETAVLP